MLLLLVSLLLPTHPAAFADVDLHEKWSFRFANGNRVFFSPAHGVFFQYANRPKEFPQLLKEEVTSFEISGYDAADEGVIWQPGTPLPEAQEWKSVATRRFTISSFVTFFTTPQGVYAVDQNGNGVTKLASDVLEFTPMDQILDGTHFYRGVGLQIKSKKGTRAKVLGYRDDHVKVEFAKDLAKGEKVTEFEFKSLHAEVTEIIEFGVKTASGASVGRLLAKDWADPDPFSRFESASKRYDFYAELGGLHHFQALEKTGGIQDADRGEAWRVLEDLLKDAEDTGFPSTVEISSGSVPALVEAVNERVYWGQYSGVLKYLPFGADLSDEAERLWISEMKKVRKLTAQYGYLLVVKTGTRTFAIYHPQGSGQFLNETLSSCNLILQ